MDIQIRQLDSQSIHQVDMFDLNSIVSSHLVLQVNDNKITYTVVPVAAYEKMLSIDTEDKIAFIDDPQKAIFFAEVGGKPVGQVKVE